jgi:hypothetical protein
MAQKVRDETGFSYLAGLWKENLYHDLLWELRVDTQTDRPTSYRAPTWVWASVDGEVDLQLIHEHNVYWECLVDLMAVHVKPDGID